MRNLRFAFIFAFALLGAAGLRAQSVRWDPPRGTLPVGQTSALRLIFEECAPKGQPAVPKVEDLTLQFYGQGSNTSIINGSVSVSETLTFAAALTKSHPVEIPGFQVETNKGTLRVPPARFEPATATLGRTGTPLNDAASAKITVTPASVWAGEVFELNATIEAARSYFPQLTRGFEWTPDPLIAESWSDPQQIEFASAGEPHTGVQYRTRAIARSPGRFNLNAATHIVNLSVGVSGFGFFQQRQYDQYSITSNTPTLEVKALPPAPAAFSGAVGDFKLVSKIVPEKAAVGEPVTWTLELSGTGNWPDIAGLPSREVSNDFQVVQPKAKRTPAENKIFDVSLAEDVVLVPSKVGSYALGPISFTYFDSKSGTYKTVTTPRKTVTITPPSAPQFGNAPGTQKSDIGKPEQPDATANAPQNPVSSPAAPAGIPRDPLPGVAEAHAPLALNTLIAWIAAPFVGLLIFWAGLALQQARQTDPLRSRREARARLAATLKKLQAASDAERPALLLQWQRDTAALWLISHAAPPAAALSEPDWHTLWEESERALYGSKPALPSDWVARAEAARTAKRVPGFQPLRLFLPRNLMPFAAVIIAALIVATMVRAENAAAGATPNAKVEPLASYRGGDFSAAEKSWRGTLGQQPTNWIARHNLSLALAQEERAGEAAAQATAAFVQNPSDPSVRWHLALASEKAGFVAAALSPFLTPGPGPLQSLARNASPANWQRVIIGSAFGAAFALGLVLYNIYNRKSRGLAWGATLLFVLALGCGAAGTLGVLAFGATADSRAAVVMRAGILRSIPTEADSSQKTTPLAAGSLALADKDFLGWTRLAFENGQTGWVRKEELVLLWK